MDQTQIDAVRSFNRFYTRFLGLLDRHLLESPYTLPEVRVLYEIYHREPVTARVVASSLDMDKGYLSRILHRLERDVLIRKEPLPEDRRSVGISLTQHGKHEFERLNEKSNRQIATLLEPLTDAERDRLVRNMTSIQVALSIPKSDPPG